MRLDEITHRVHRSASAAEHGSNMLELGMMAIILFVSGFLLVDAIRDQEPWYSYVSAVILLFIPLYMFLWRRHRLQRDRGFDDSLRGFLDKGIANVEYQIAHRRTFFWWFVLPSAISVLLPMIFEWSDRPIWSWMLLPIAYVLAFIVLQFGSRKEIRQKRNLEALKQQLLQSEPS